MLTFKCLLCLYDCLKQKCTRVRVLHSKFRALIDNRSPPGERRATILKYNVSCSTKFSRHTYRSTKAQNLNLAARSSFVRAFGGVSRLSSSKFSSTAVGLRNLRTEILKIVSSIHISGVLGVLVHV